VFTAEAIMFELAGFLEAHYGAARGETVLDVGAGTRPYQELYGRYFERCVSTDVGHSQHDIQAVDVIAPAESLPFDDGAFDAVICTEVLEHVKRPRDALREIQRVLRPKGQAFITTPFMVQLHEMPYDFYRYTPSALTELAESTGLTVTSLTPRGDYLALMIALTGYPVVKLFTGLSRLTHVNLVRSWNPVVYLTLIAPQRLYFWWWRRLRSGKPSLARTIHNRLNHFALGYTLTVEKA
jgi:SAM-dependent methyltransferase